MTTRIHDKTGVEEHFEYFGSSPDLKLGRLLTPGRTTGTGVVIARSIDADRRLTDETREVTEALTGMGHAVLRLDYRGQGQSLGDPGDLDLDVMTADLSQAVDWFRETASIETIAILGIGLGATAVVLNAEAGEMPLAVWNPVPNFEEFLHGLARSKLATDWGLVPDGAPYEGRSLAEVVAEDLTNDEFGQHDFFDAGGLVIGAIFRSSAERHSDLDLLAEGNRPLFAATAENGKDLVTATAQWLDRCLSGSGDRS